MNPDDVEAVEVTQADRASACSILIPSKVPEQYWAKIMDGEWDHTNEVQVLARHRITTLRTQAPMPAASTEPMYFLYTSHSTAYPGAPDHVVVTKPDARWANHEGWTETPLYAAPPVQAPMPEEVVELVRYHAFVDADAGEGPWFEMASEGRWAKYADANAIIQFLQREVERLQVVASESEEMQDLAKQEGISETLQAIDMLTGGDGEYRYCMGDNGNERHCPDEPAMRDKIVARFTAAQRVKDEAVAWLDAASKSHSPACWLDLGGRAFLAQHRGEHG